VGRLLKYKELGGFQDLLGLEQFGEHGFFGVEFVLQLGDFLFLLPDLFKDNFDGRPWRPRPPGA
jgi:hypothetical protein